MNASAVGSNTSKVREAMEHGMSLRCGDQDPSRLVQRIWL